MGATVMGKKCCLALLTVAFLLGAGRLLAEGLDANYSKKLVTVYDEGDKIPKLKGKRCKVLLTGVLKPGEERIKSKVLFERNALCIVVGYGRGEDSDLDVYVKDSDSGNAIGKDTELDNFPLVSWQSSDDSKYNVDIRVHNAGKKACSFVLLANY
jgi:hypothetical protein